MILTLIIYEVWDILKCMEKEIQSQKGNFFSFVWEVIKIAVLALVIILPVRYFIAQPFCVKGASMEPNFQDGGYLIIDELSYRFNQPQRNQVIVFRFPEDPKQFFIKRIVALPNETIEIKNNKVKIYNEENPLGLALDEPYLAANQITEGSQRVELGEDEYFVLGDNRLHSSDSRRWGPLDKTFITGKVFVTLWESDFILCRLKIL